MKADMRLAHIVVQTGRLPVSQDPFGPSRSRRDARHAAGWDTRIRVDH
jgi:hypothetical protein